MQHLETAILKRLEVARGPVPGLAPAKPKAKTSTDKPKPKKAAKKPTPKTKPASTKTGKAKPKTTLKAKPRKGTDEWWKSQTKTFQKKYLKEHPSSKFNPANRAKRKKDDAKKPKPKAGIPASKPKNVLKRKKDSEKQKKLQQKKKERQAKIEKLKKVKSDRLLKKKKEALDRALKKKKDKINLALEVKKKKQNHALEVKKKKLMQALEHKRAKAKQDMEEKQRKDEARKESERKKKAAEILKKKKSLALKSKKKAELEAKKKKQEKEAEDKRKALEKLIRDYEEVDTEREAQEEKDFEGPEDEDLPDTRTKKEKFADWYESAVQSLGQKVAETIARKVSTTLGFPDITSNMPDFGKPSYVKRHDLLTKKLAEIDKEIQDLKSKREKIINKIKGSGNISNIKMMRNHVEKYSEQIKEKIKERQEVRTKAHSIQEKADEWYAQSKSQRRSGSRKSKQFRLNKGTGAGKVVKRQGEVRPHKKRLPKPKPSKPSKPKNVLKRRKR